MLFRSIPSFFTRPPSRVHSPSLPGSPSLHPPRSLSLSLPPSLPSFTQANLKKFMEYVQQRSTEKLSKFLEKGLDPNFHDPDTGGETVHALLVCFSSSSVALSLCLCLSLFGLSLACLFIPPPAVIFPQSLAQSTPILFHHSVRPSYCLLCLSCVSFPF